MKVLTTDLTLATIDRKKKVICGILGLKCHVW